MPVFRLALVWALVDREIDEAFASTLNSPATRSCSASMLFFFIRTYRQVGAAADDPHGVRGSRPCRSRRSDVTAPIFGMSWSSEAMQAEPSKAKSRRSFHPTAHQVRWSSISRRQRRLGSSATKAVAHCRRGNRIRQAISVVGTFETCPGGLTTSALRGTADIPRQRRRFRF